MESFARVMATCRAEQLRETVMVVALARMETRAAKDPRPRYLSQSRKSASTNQLKVPTNSKVPGGWCTFVNLANIRVPEDLRKKI
jgi:hypothetical protein